MPPLPRTHPTHRPAFAFGGWVMLLFLILIGACLVNSYLIWSRLPPPGRGAYQAGFRIGIWATPVIIPLIALGLGWLVGKLVALMFGNSDDAGNIGASVVLLGFISLFGYGIYSSATAPTPTPASANSNSSTPPPSSPATIDATEAAARLAEQQSAQLKAMQERSQQNLEAMREASRKQLEALRTGAPPPPPTPNPAAANPGTAPSEPARPSQPQLNPAIRPTIDAFEKELNAQVDALVALSSKTLSDLQRTPPHDAARLKARLADVESLRAAADALKKTFDGASDALAAKLQAVGVSQAEARAAASRWAGFDYKLTSRGFAADSLGRLCDKAREECEYLRDNLGKWTLDSKGEVKCGDFQIKSKIRSLRFFVKADADRKTQLIDQLSGK